MLPKNPYIGPRTFQPNEGHLFFGREREARDLIALVSTERLVVFYAQSGAGKSSLINTRLLQALATQKYEVLPIGRVSGDTASGIAVDNIFVFNLLRRLEQHDTNPETLAHVSLPVFLAHLNFDAKGFFYDPTPLESFPVQPGATITRRALIMDQFEELFSTHPEAWDKRGEFFQQIARAMQEDPYLWVVLVMREDYIAYLDPYAHLLLNGLRVRYYMERLDREAAIEATEKPVEKIRPYAPGVAKKLVNNLSRIKVQKQDEHQHDPLGKYQARETSDENDQSGPLGQYVEPVQLQVVCYNLWENLKPGNQITNQDLKEMGDVDQALERYYEGRVRAVAQQKNVSERSIREWFGEQLITSSGTRNIVLQNKTGGSLPDPVIQTLQGDLVRAETRAGQVWYELSHDRLIEPIQKNNQAWFEKNLSPFQRLAELWVQQGRSTGLLLRGADLTKAEQEVQSLQEDQSFRLTDDEDAFLKASQVERQREQRDLRQRRTISVALIISVLLFIVAVLFALSATRATEAARQAQNAALAAQFDAQQASTAAVAGQIAADKANATAQASEADAKKQRDRALAGNLAAQADSLKNNSHSLALLLGIEAYERDPSILTRTTLFQLLQFSPYQLVPGFAGPVSSLAISPQRDFIATASCALDDKGLCRQGEIRLLDENLAPIGKTSNEDFGIVYSMVFHQYDQRLVLAAGGCVRAGCSSNEGQITLWDVTNPRQPTLLSSFGGTNTGHGALVKTIAFSPERPEGTILASGSYDTTILLWDVSDPSAPKRMKGRSLDHASFVNSMAFSQDGKILVSAGDDRSIYIWDLGNLASVPLALPDRIHGAPVTSVALTSNNSVCEGGSMLATASDDSSVILWTWCPPFNESGLKKLFELKGHSGYVKTVAFNADGSQLASAGFDNKIILWDTKTGEQVGPVLKAHTRAITAVIYGTTGSDKPYLLSASDDRTIIRWDLSTRSPLSRTLYLAPSEENSRNNQTQIDQYQLLASATKDQNVILQDVSGSASQDFLKLEGFDSQVKTVYFDGKQLITIDNNNQKMFWVIDPQDWLDLACRTAQSNLTEEDWNQFLALVSDQYKETCLAGPQSLGLSNP